MTDNWHNEKTYESMITYGYQAIKFVFIANGAAIISILTFLGQHNEKAAQLNSAIKIFVIGVVLAGITYLTAYLTQYSLYNETQERWREGIHSYFLCISVIAFIFGITCFCGGAWLSADVLALK